MSIEPKFLDKAGCLEMGRACLCFNIRKAARAISHLYDKFLRPAGLRATQFALLMAIRINGPVTLTRLAKVTVMDRTTLSRNLVVLEKRRLIQIQSGEDRREREISLTPLGDEILEKAASLWAQAQGHIQERLGLERLENLLCDLKETITLTRKV
ncbi:MAG: MarR family winged helix-turn-helix transcriptional regulator [Desulfobaccales bacterium]